LRALLYFFSGTFFAGLFLFIWRNQYARSVQELESTALQLTAIISLREGSYRNQRSLGRCQ